VGGRVQGARKRMLRKTTTLGSRALGRAAIGLVMLTVPLAAGCSKNAAPPVTPESGPLAGELVDAAGNPAPPWVTAPSKYRKDVDDHKVVCGAGSVGGTANMNMAQSGAAGRARTALARTLE